MARTHRSGVSLMSSAFENKADDLGEAEPATTASDDGRATSAEHSLGCATTSHGRGCRGVRFPPVANLGNYIIKSNSYAVILAPRRGIAGASNFNDLAQSGSLNRLAGSRGIMPGVTHR
jgi:hypothetical protein